MFASPRCKVTSVPSTLAIIPVTVLVFSSWTLSCAEEAAAAASSVSEAEAVCSAEVSEEHAVSARDKVRASKL